MLNNSLPTPRDSATMGTHLWVSKSLSHNENPELPSELRSTAELQPKHHQLCLCLCDTQQCMGAGPSPTRCLLSPILLAWPHAGHSRESPCLPVLSPFAEAQQLCVSRFDPSRHFIRANVKTRADEAAISGRFNERVAQPFPEQATDCNRVAAVQKTLGMDGSLCFQPVPIHQVHAMSLIWDTTTPPSKQHNLASTVPPLQQFGSMELLQKQSMHDAPTTGAPSPALLPTLFSGIQAQAHLLSLTTNKSSQQQSEMLQE